MDPPVLEYFSFHSDFTRIFCCDEAVSGYNSLRPTTHALNDFITDIKTCGEPRRLIDGTKWQTHERKSYNAPADGILRLMSELPSAPKWKSKVKLLSTHEEGVLEKCIVLVEYFPQSRNESGKRPGMPSMRFGRPLYGRQGQKVWVGRAYPESDEMRARREAEEYEKSLRETPGIGEAGERVAVDGEKEQRMSWDWQPGNDSEVVQATSQILENSREGVVDTKKGVWAQSWECTKCSEGRERPGNPRKKWRFAIYYKNVPVNRSTPLKADTMGTSTSRRTCPKKHVKDKRDLAVEEDDTLKAEDATLVVE